MTQIDVRATTASLAEPNSSGAATARPEDVATPRLQSGDATRATGAPMAPFTPPAKSQPPMSVIDDRQIGDGRNEKARAARAERHASFVHQFIEPFAKLKAESDAYRGRLSNQNLPPETDYRGQKFTMGASLVFGNEVLVPDSPDFVPPGRRISGFDLSSDGRFVAYATAGTGDDRIWRVLDRATRKDVIDPVRFNSFGNKARFSADGKGFIYPDQKLADIDGDGVLDTVGAKVRPRLMYQSLEHATLSAVETRPAARAPKPVEFFKGQSVLPHSVYPLDADTALAAANLTIGSAPGFPLFTSVVTRGADGSFSADASRAFPAGMIGRVVSTDPKRVIVQTESTDQTYALVAFDPRSGGVTELVPSRPDAVLHICQRVGDSILAWYQDGKKYTLHRFDLDGNPKPFMVDGQERPHIEPADLGMPDWCNPGLSFTGDENSTSFTDFTVNSKLKSTRTFRIDLNSGALIPRLSGKEVDLDESKFVEYHGTFEARDGYPVPAHLWIPKSKLADVPEPLEIENGVLKKIHFRDGEK
ncbi:MAG: hypothetical protein AAFY60_09945, partial [Myxococcota bacterium]